MNSKIFTFFILFITVFSFFTFTFATEETHLITITGQDNNTYSFPPFTLRDGQCILTYIRGNYNDLFLYFFNKPISYVYDSDNKKIIITTIDGSETNTQYCYRATFDNSLNYFTNWRIRETKNITTNVFQIDISNSYNPTTFLNYYDNTDPLKNLPIEPDDPDIPVEPDDPDTPVEPDDPDIPVEPDDPDTPVEPDDPDTPNEEIVIDSTEINNNLTKIYTGIQFIVSFLSLGAVVLLIYIVYKLFSIFFPF